MQWVLVTFFVALDDNFPYDSYRGHSILFSNNHPPYISCCYCISYYTFCNFQIYQEKNGCWGKSQFKPKKPKENRLLKLVFIVIAFAIFWLPFAGWKIYLTMENYENYNHLIGIVFQYLALFNSVANPFIHIVVFRRQT